MEVKKGSKKGTLLTDCYRSLVVPSDNSTREHWCQRTPSKMSKLRQVDAPNYVFASFTESNLVIMRTQSGKNRAS